MCMRRESHSEHCADLILEQNLLDASSIAVNSVNFTHQIKEDTLNLTNSCFLVPH